MHHELTVQLSNFDERALLYLRKWIDVELSGSYYFDYSVVLTTAFEEVLGVVPSYQANEIAENLHNGWMYNAIEIHMETDAFGSKSATAKLYGIDRDDLGEETMTRLQRPKIFEDGLDMSRFYFRD